MTPQALAFIAAVLALNGLLLNALVVRPYRRANPDPIERKRAAFRHAADRHLSLVWWTMAYFAALIFWQWVSGWPSLTGLAPVAAVGAAFGVLHTAALFSRSMIMLSVAGPLYLVFVVGGIPISNVVLDLGFSREQWGPGMKMSAMLLAMSAFALVQLPARPWVQRLRATLGEEPESPAETYLQVPRGVEP